MAERAARADVVATATAAASAVDPAWTTQALVRLVRTPSVTGDERAAQDAVAELLEEIGAAVERIETDPARFAVSDPDWPGQEMPRTDLPVVVGRIGRPGGSPRVLLVGHVDVVPVGDPATWTVDPWGAEIRDGDLYGRGAVDMKGGCASILGAVRALVSSGASEAFKGELVAAFVPSEEDGGQGMLAAIRAGVVGDAAVITEPTDMDVVIAHAGAITFRLTVPGRAAHASVRRGGVSALDKLMVLVRALEADEAERNAAEVDPLMTAIGLPYPTIIGKVSGGDWASSVIDRIVADGRYGVALGETWRDAEARLRRVIDNAIERDPFFIDHPPTVEIVGGRFSSSRIPADHVLPVAIADAAEATLGRRPAFLGEPYGADMRLLVNEGRTPTVIYGPGHIALAHSADESVPLDDVSACARVLAAWAVRELA
ncbi:MAG TPA: ArgE/DapE family deacylase [Candidatus Limnocylindrales bacterium]|nr:ArgE/DapE family deacylase [Candidatus Limnocylindrales bacterium]